MIFGESGERVEEESYVCSRPYRSGTLFHSSLCIFHLEEVPIRTEDCDRPVVTVGKREKGKIVERRIKRSWASFIPACVHHAHKHHGGIEIRGTTVHAARIPVCPRIAVATRGRRGGGGEDDVASLFSSSPRKKATTSR